MTFMRKLVGSLVALALSFGLLLSIASPAMARSDPVRPIKGDMDMSDYLNCVLSFESVEKSGQYLNILKENLENVVNYTNVTSWTYDRNDALQKWRIYEAPGMEEYNYYRICNSTTTEWALDFYWGSGENYHNADVYWYPMDSVSYDDYAVVFRDENLIDGVGGKYGIVKIRSEEPGMNYALTITDTPVLSTGYDVRWIVAPQDDDSQIWHIDKLT